MSESEQNIPKGVRTNYPKRPSIDEDAWSKIRASQERMKDREFFDIQDRSQLEAAPFQRT